jgi:hypothetical protein
MLADGKFVTLWFKMRISRFDVGMLFDLME